MSVDQNQAAVRRSYDAINRFDLTVAAEVIAPNYVGN